MALITCPECGREVSDQAEACPRCAYPIAKKLAAAKPPAPAQPAAAPVPRGDARVGTGGAPRDEDEAGPEEEPLGDEESAEAAGDESEADAGGEGAERVLWQGTPSQLINFKPFAGYFLVIAIIVVLTVLVDRLALHSPMTYWGLLLVVMPLLPAAWKWLRIRCHRYELTSERIKLQSGVLAREHEVIELYRVKDIALEKPFLMRLFGLGNVTAITSDKTLPTFTFYAVRGPDKLYETLRRNVEARRVKRRVREVDME